MKKTRKLHTTAYLMGGIESNTVEQFGTVAFRKRHQQSHCSMKCFATLVLVFAIESVGNALKKT